MNDSRASTRVAHALLRLYPRAWRARYGDEWLAHVDATGLTWRDTLDVVGAAGLERLRGFVRWRTREIDPETAERQMLQGPTRSFLIEAPIFIALVAGIFAAFSPWVPFPTHWFIWYWLVGQSSLRYSELAGAGSTCIERVAITFYYFIESLALTILLWSGGRLLVILGVPRPSEGVAIAVLIGIGLAVVIVAVLGGFTGVTARRWRILKNSLFAFIFCLGFGDNSGEAFWTAVAFVFGCARLPYSMSPAFHERQRAARAALQERMEREFPIKPGGYF